MFVLYCQQILVDPMQRGNTMFYHGHIQSNIARLDERKDKFITHRLDFLKQFCLPIEEKTKQIHVQIEKYKNMRDTQEEVIQNQPDIVKLKEEIKNYMETHRYFQEKLGQYERKSLDLEHYNHTLYARIQQMKDNMKNKTEEIGFKLPAIIKNRINTIFSEKEEIDLHNSFALPSVKAQTQEISSNSSRVDLAKKKLVRIGEKIQRIQSHHFTQQTALNSAISEVQTKQSREQTNQMTKKMQLLRLKITQFNKTQALFRDCFQTKKNSVQKSVSQLQSKLIVNRQQFLNICQAINSKDKAVTFVQFSKLSSDQIITLFISFVWLNRRLGNEFMQKRKVIMDVIGKLPKSNLL